MALRYETAKRVAPIFIVLPIAGWAAFMIWSAYFGSVVVPDSDEFNKVRAFVLSNPEVLREFGSITKIVRGDRYRVRLTGVIKDGFFSFEITGTKRSGVVDAHWTTLAAGVVEVTAIREQIPWRDTVPIYKKGPNQSPEPTAMSVTPPAAQEPRQP